MNLSNFDVQMYEYAVEEAKSLRETQPDWSKFKTVKELCAMGFTMEQASYGVTKLSNPELTIADFLEPKQIHTAEETKTAMSALDDIEKIVERRGKEIKHQGKKIEQFGEEIADLKKSVSNLAKAVEDEDEYEERDQVKEHEVKPRASKKRAEQLDQVVAKQQEKCKKAIEDYKRQKQARMDAKMRSAKKRAEQLAISIAAAQAEADAQADTLLADIRIIPPVEHKPAEAVKYTSTPLVPPSSDYIRPVEQPKQYEVTPLEPTEYTSALLVPPSYDKIKPKKKFEPCTVTLPAGPKGYAGNLLVPPIHNLKPDEIKQPKQDPDKLRAERAKQLEKDLARAKKEADRKAKSLTSIATALKHSLEIARPDLAAEFDVEKNETTPDKFLPSSKTEVWWKCKDCGYEYKAKIYNRVYAKAGCPECKARRKTGIRKQSLLNANPEIASEFMSEKNGITPDQVAATTKKIYWFKCNKCGREWQARVVGRTVNNSENCPDCGDMHLIKLDLVSDKNKSFGALYPELLKEWSKNNKYDPMSISTRFHLPILWKCEHCKKEYELNLGHRLTEGQGCTNCNHGFNYQLALQTRYIQNNVLVCEPKQTNYWMRNRTKGFTNLKKTLLNTRFRLQGKDIRIDSLNYSTYYMYTIKKTKSGYVGLGYYYINDISESDKDVTTVYSTDLTGTAFTTDAAKKSIDFWTRKTGLYLTTKCSENINEVFKILLNEMLNKTSLRPDEIMLLNQYLADLKANKDTDEQIVLPINDVVATAGETE